MWRIKYTNESGDLCSVEPMKTEAKLRAELRYIIEEGAQLIIIMKE